MKTNLDHLPPVKQHELARVVEIILEEFEDALKGASAEFKKRGRILKIILFGSYARGTFVDEPRMPRCWRWAGRILHSQHQSTASKRSATRTLRPGAGGIAAGTALA